MTGGGVPYADFALHEAHGEQNRPVFAQELATWLDAVPGLTTRLQRPGAHLADVGCGVGWGAIRLADLFAPGDLLERLFHAFSVLHCLAVGMAEPGSEATGTVMRPSTLRSYAARAGFSRVEDVELGSDVFRGYRLVD